MNLVVFDFDGTLVDTSRAVQQAYEKVRSNYGGRTLQQDEIEHVLGGSEAVSRLLVSALGDENIPGDESVAAFETALGEAFPLEARLFPGVYRTLLRLEQRGQPAALVGPWTDNTLGRLAGDVGLDGYVQPIQSFTRDGVEDLNASIEQLTDGPHLAPDRMLYVSDNVPHLVKLASRGIPTAYVRYGYGGYRLDELPDNTAEIDRITRVDSLVS